MTGARKWKGRAPIITRDQYEQLVATLAHRRGKKDGGHPDTVAALARQFGIRLATAYSAARYGIKRYEHEAANAQP